MKKYTINSLLESWGKGKRELPPNNDSLKAAVLFKLPERSASATKKQPRRTPWLSLGFAAAALLVFLTQQTGLNIKSGNLGVAVPAVEQSGVASAPSVVGYDSSYKVSVPQTQSYRPSYDESISDSREFLKVYYNSTLKTLDQSLTASHVESIIHSAGGRIDSNYRNERSAGLSFAIPKEELSQLRFELRDLVGKKFYIEYSSSENLLPRKQAIEEGQRQNDASLSSLNNERAQIVLQHSRRIADLQNNVKALSAEIDALSREYGAALPERQAAITLRLSELQSYVTTITSQIASENKTYSSKINSIDSRIKSAENNRDSLNIQDQSLLNNVETVNGHITITKISPWEMADTYVPGPLAVWLLILAALATYFYNRRTYITLPQD